MGSGKRKAQGRLGGGRPGPGATAGQLESAGPGETAHRQDTGSLGHGQGIGAEVTKLHRLHSE